MGTVFCRILDQPLPPPSPKVINIKDSRILGIDDRRPVARRHQMQLRRRPDVERFD
jgi:hypothetical protein